MGLFSSEFDIVVNHSKEEAFDRFLDYVKNKRSLKLTHSHRSEMLAYIRRISLFSWPINFTISFSEINEHQTRLSVNSSSGTVDWGKTKGMINDIVKEIY